MEDTPTNEFANKESLVPWNNERRDGAMRIDQAAPLVFSHFNSGQLFSEHKSRFYNQSEAGACVYTMQKFPLGTILFLRMKGCPSEASSHDEPQMRNPVRTTTLAEVRWCNPIKTNETKIAYKLGIKYL